MKLKIFLFYRIDELLKSEKKLSPYGFNVQLAENTYSDCISKLVDIIFDNYRVNLKKKLCHFIQQNHLKLTFTIFSYNKDFIEKNKEYQSQLNMNASDANSNFCCDKEACECHLFNTVSHY